MRGLVEILVVVDAEHARAARRGSDSTDLRLEEARRHMGENHERRKTVVVRNADAHRIAGDLGLAPLDGESDRRVAQYAEVEGRPVRILPDVLAIHHHILSEGLLETGVELIARAGLQGRRQARIALSNRHDRIDRGVAAPGARQNQVFVEWRFHGPGIRNPQDAIGWLDIVGNPEARLHRAGLGDAVVRLAADPQVESPVLPGISVLGKQGQLLDIGVAIEGVQAAGRIGAPIGGGQQRGPGQVVAAEQRHKAGIRLQHPGALLRIGQRGRQVEASVRIQTDGIERGIDNPEAVTLRQKGLSVVDSHLQVVMALGVRHVRVGGRIHQTAVLADSLSLEIGREIGKRIPARVVVILIPPHGHAEGKRRARIEQAHPGWRDVVGSDFRTLILGTDRQAVGTETPVVRHQSGPPRCVFGVVRIGRLEPGAREAEVQVDGVLLGELQVDAVEHILLIAVIVHYLVLRPIQKSASVHSVHGNEVTPRPAAVSQVKPSVRRAEAAVAGRHVPMGLGDAQARSRSHHNHHAGLVAIFGGRGALDHLHGLHRLGRNLIREDLALLVGNLLAVDRERI